MAAPAQAEALGIAARAEVTEQYSFPRMVGVFDEVYRTELQSRGINFFSSSEDSPTTTSISSMPIHTRPTS